VSSSFSCARILTTKGGRAVTRGFPLPVLALTWILDKSQGSWSWFEIVVFADAETDEIKRTKDGTRMEYKSHANQLAHHLDRTMHYGLMFDRRTQLLANIEAGDVLAVRACVRFLSWKNYGYSAFITTRMLKEGTSCLNAL
jgi:hypothetical protein